MTDPTPIDEALTRVRAAGINEAARAVEEKLRKDDGLSTDELDAALAALNGRGAHAKRPQSVIEALEDDVRAAEAATPWRDAAAFTQREALREAESRFVALVSTRRGQTIEAARNYVEGVLREAWHRPGGLGSRTDRLAATVRALEEGIDSLSKLSPIASTRATESGKPRMVQIVHEGKPL